MTPELQTQLSAIFTSLTETVKATSNFYVEQTPIVLQQLLYWKMTESLIYFVSLLALNIMAIFILVRVILYFSQGGDDYDFSVVFALCLVVIIFASPLMLSNLTWLQILIAPKAYLLEYLQHAIK